MIAALSHVQVSLAQTKIMCLGNSITQGNEVHPSYRYLLWKKLIDAEVNFVYVGSHSTNRDDNKKVEVESPVIGSEYNEHIFTNVNEGHWGWRTDQILNGNSGQPTKLKLSQWLEGYTPDIVLMHLGTNDVFDNQSTSSTLEELQLVISTLRSVNKDVIILIAKLIPANRASLGDKDIPERLEDLNNEIAKLAPTLSTTESPVILVDQNNDFNPTPGVDTWDGIHPNTSGEKKMAEKWFDAIVEALGTVPVSLHSFKANLLHTNEVHLSWQTASEINNSHFEVQRSGDNVDFRTIGRVAGAGNSSINIKYTFTDKAAPVRQLYYRLKQVDFDSTFAYSNVVAVQNSNSKNISISLYPTLAKDAVVTLQAEALPANETVEVAIHSIEGKLVKRTTAQTDETGKLLLKIALPKALSAGLYTARTTVSDQLYQHKLIIE
ncbi:GDSL-type esterase/lipase family protein [Pontibacter harenae]|uniref:GDSL-type esterase/lipase family protein n=1 Tax=Pontibacter harenae TaxID=2894083 RepID=UPI001E5F4440|nr:GDSL-type esterase/lipase family protein [Pontibacter harenae]MCC9166756.1 GDSL-type esterase/lipase family protein [Pontibacter harenae]